MSVISLFSWESLVEMYVQIQSVVKTPRGILYFLRKQFDALCGQKRLIYHNTYN